jgi:hypothetical protein
LVFEALADVVRASPSKKPPAFIDLAAAAPVIRREGPTRPPTSGSVPRRVNMCVSPFDFVLCELSFGCASVEGPTHISTRSTVQVPSAPFV